MPLEAGSVFARLGARLDDDAFDRFDKRLDKARRDSRDDVEAKLKADADTRGFDRYERRLNDVDDGHNRLVRGSGRVKTAMGSLFVGGAGVAGAAVGFGLLAKGAMGAVTAFQESNQIAQRTTNVLKSTGGAAHVTAKEVSDLATAISQKTGIDDEAIQSGENLLLTFTNVRNEAGKGNDIFNQSTSIMADMSAALGQDMSSSAIQLGKALNDPVKGVTALQRVGVSFTAQQKDQIKTLVDSGKTVDAQKLILGELRKEFGGAGEATATASGKMKVAFGNLQESVGGALAPTFNKAADALTGFVQGMQSGQGAGGKFADFSRRAFGTVKDVIGDVARAGARAFDWLRNNKDVQTTVRNLGTYFGIVKDAVVDVGRSIGDAFGSGSGAGSSIRQIIAFVLKMDAVFSSVYIAVARRAIPGITGALKGLVSIVRGVVDIVAGILTGDFGKVWDGVKRIVSGAMRVVGGLLRAVTAPLRELGSRAIAAGKDLVDGLVNRAKKVPGDLWRAIKGAAGKVADLAGDLASAAAKAGSRLVTRLVNTAKDLPGDLWRAIKGGVSRVGQLERDLGAKALDAGKTLVSTLIDKASELPGKLLSVGKRAVSALGRGLAGLPGAISNALQAGGQFFGNIGRGVADWINAHTPFGDTIKIGPAHVRLPALAQGGRVGPGTGGPRVFIAGEGNADEWVISQEGDRGRNVQWAREALETLTGRSVLLHRTGKGPSAARASRAEAGVTAARNRLEALNRTYAQTDRRFNISSEEFIGQDAEGNAVLDKGAIGARSAELDELIKQARAIKAATIALRDRVNRARAVIENVARRFRTASTRGPKKRRSGYRDKANELSGRASDLGSEIPGLNADIADRGIDVDELTSEQAGVLGTALPPAAPAQPQAPTLETSMTDAEKGTAAGLERAAAEAALTPDAADDEAARGAAEGFWRGVLDRLKSTGASDPVITEAARAVAGTLPTAAPAATSGAPPEIAAAVIAAIGDFNASRADLFGSLGANFLGAGSGPLSDVGQAAGLRYFGGGSSGTDRGTIAGAGGVTQNVYLTLTDPNDTHTFTRSALHDLKAAV